MQQGINIGLAHGISYRYLGLSKPTSVPSAQYTRTGTVHVHLYKPLSTRERIYLHVRPKFIAHCWQTFETFVVYRFTKHVDLLKLSETF